MRVKRMLTIFTAVLTGVFYSCSDEQDDVVVPTETNGIEEEIEYEERYRTVSEEGQIINYLYYMDEEESDYFDLENEDLYIVVTTERSEDGTEGVFRIWGFSSREGYVKFGNKHGGDLEKGLEFEEHMRDYAESSGAIEYYEETGEVPDWYITYNEEYYNSMFGGTNEASEGRINAPISTTFLYQDVSGGRTNLMIGYTPFLFLGWNNTVSRYYNLYIYGVTTFHDRWGYRDPFFSIWDWGWKDDLTFTGPFAFANDRMSSGFSFGLLF